MLRYEKKPELLHRLTLTRSKSSGVSLLALIWSQLLLAGAAQVWLSARTNTSPLVAPNILQQSSGNIAEKDPASAVGFWERCRFILASESCVGPKGVCALGTHAYVAIQGQCMLAQISTTAPCKRSLQSSLHQRQLERHQVFSWCRLNSRTDRQTMSR